MPWKSIREAAAAGDASLATWKRRVASGAWPSYVAPDEQGGPGVRMVWVGQLPAELLADEVARLRALVEGLTPAGGGGLTREPAPSRQVLRVVPPAERAAAAPAERRPSTPSRAKPSRSVATPPPALARLVELAGGISAAARLVGVGQPTASRWCSGKRRVSPAHVAKIEDLVRELELAAAAA